MPKVHELFAFIISDQDEEDEGIMAFKSADAWLPMVGADIKRIEALRPIAESISRQIGKPYRVVRFQAVEDIELQGPPITIHGLTFELIRHDERNPSKDEDR